MIQCIYTSTPDAERQDAESVIGVIFGSKGSCLLIGAVDASVPDIMKRERGSLPQQTRVVGEIRRFLSDCH